MRHYIGLVRFPLQAQERGDRVTLQRLIAPYCAGPARVEGDHGLLIGWGHARSEPALSRPRFLHHAAGISAGGDARLGDPGELAAALGLDRTAQTGVLLAHAWARWGADTPNHVDGDFAFAAFDPAAARIHLVRDHTAQRPLFFVHRPGAFLAFSDLPGPLLDLPEVDPRIDEVAVAAITTLNVGPQTRTGYRELSRVPRAHVASFDPARATFTRWWNPTPTFSTAGMRDADYVDAARTLLDRCVGLYAAPDERIGLQVSGGLDSCAVAESALRQRIGPAIGYSVLADPGDCVWHPRGKCADQNPTIDALAAFFPQLPIRRLRYESMAGDDGALDRLRRTRLPALVPHVAGQFDDCIRAMRRDGITVALGGQLGNQTLSAAGNALFRDLLRSGRWVRLVREVLAAAPGEGWPGLRAALRSLVPIAPGGFGSRRRQPAGAPPTGMFMNPDLLARLEAQEGRVSVLQHDTAPGALPRMLAMRDGVYLDALYLPWRLAGIDLGMPLFDRRIVEFALSVPSDQYRRNGVTRWLMRRLLDGRLPDAQVWDERYGFDLSDMPIRGRQWLEGLRGAAAALQHGSAVPDIVDMPAIEAALAEDWPASAAFGYRDFRRITALANAITAAQLVQMSRGANG